jgi:hypothetical protein
MPFPLSPCVARPPGAIAVVALAGASLVAASAVGSIFLRIAGDSWTAIAAAGPAGPADGILLVSALGGALLSLWLGLGMTLSALSALPGAVGHACRLLAGWVAPAAVRKVVAFVLGTTLTAALLPGSAVAGTGHDTPRPTVVAARNVSRAVRSAADAAPDASFRFVSDPVPDMDDGMEGMDGKDCKDGKDGRDGRDGKEAAPPPSWSPERPVSRDSHVSSPKPALPQVCAPTADGIVVHRGDSLWSIAARHLGPTASDAEIDAEYPRWFAANREVIGNDANLILPGQLLSPPRSPQGDS